MAWRAILDSDLKTRLSGSELQGFRAAALGTAQIDPVQPIIEQITDLIRGYVAACADNILGATGTIPDELMGPAIDLIVPEMSKRCAGVILDPKGLREKAADTALSILRDVASCDFTIGIATTPGVEPLGSDVAVLPSIYARVPMFGRSYSDGI